jgi:hypothetical protein
MKNYYLLKSISIKIFFFMLLGFHIQAQNVFIKGNIKNTNLSELSYYRQPNAFFSFIPSNRKSVVPIDKKGDFFIQTELYAPEEWILQFGNAKIALFVQPKEEMNIYISFEKGGSYKLIIKGLHAKEQELRQKMYELQQQKMPTILSLQDSLFGEYPSWDEIGFDYTEMEKLDTTFWKFYETNLNYFPLYTKIRDKKLKPDSLLLTDNDAALYSAHYNACIMAYLKHKDTAGFHFSPLASRHPLLLRFELATQALSGKVRDAALSQIVANALKEGSWVGDTLYLRYQKIVYSSEFRWAMRHFAADLFRETLAQKGKKMQIFEQSYGKNWQEIFAKYPKQILYVDIWQDHCRPCLYEMEQSLFLQKQNIGDSIVFLFLFLGKNKQQWKSILGKQQIAGQHYIIKRSKNLEKWMEVAKGSAAVPHYLIIGRNGEFFDKNAPFPDNEKWNGVMQKCLFQGQNR